MGKYFREWGYRRGFGNLNANGYHLSVSNLALGGLGNKSYEPSGFWENKLLLFLYMVSPSGTRGIKGARDMGNGRIGVKA